MKLHVQACLKSHVKFLFLSLAGVTFFLLGLLIRECLKSYARAYFLSLLSSSLGDVSVLPRSDVCLVCVNCHEAWTEIGMSFAHVQLFVAMAFFESFKKSVLRSTCCLLLLLASYLCVGIFALVVCSMFCSWFYWTVFPSTHDAGGEKFKSLFGVQGTSTRHMRLCCTRLCIAALVAPVLNGRLALCLT